jgi:hypothetical protein
MATITSRDYLNHRLLTFEPPSFATATGPELDDMAKRFGVDRDPWIVVGTTTIDGPWSQVDEMLGFANLVDDDVFLLGGRHVRPREYVADSYAAKVGDVKVVVCDIVRSQSEIDAEQRAEFAIMARKIDEEELADYFSRPTCPECGPHGNAGRVLGADLWYPCTLCAGGRPGDMHEVQRETRVVEVAPGAEWPKRGGLQGFPDDMFSIPQPPSPLAGPFTITITAETDAAETALIAGGASSEVAQQGVRSFLGALNHSKPHAELFEVGSKVRQRDGSVCTVEWIHDNEPRYLLSGSEGHLAGWRDTACLRAVQ